MLKAFTETILFYCSTLYTLPIDEDEDDEEDGEDEEDNDEGDDEL